MTPCPAIYALKGLKRSGSSVIRMLGSEYSSPPRREQYRYKKLGSIQIETRSVVSASACILVTQPVDVQYTSKRNLLDCGRPYFCKVM